MSRINECHKTLNDQGVGKCSVPMWCMGSPSGFCDEPAYGEYIRGKTRRDGWTGEVFRLDGKYNGYVPALACPRHAGPKVRVYMDGNKYCAVGLDFISLQESNAGFGETKELAIADLNVR